ncbi:18456_t:CDS:2 [Funneliformis geosporum]|uniref:Small ribosomal subunit protein uS3m n=1 Tax=Funneliformis geosporum TaxID=1117311 RepID=A0A9W4SW88_9GLOM|nr:16723_t:CDS:2 [Funneliformis geosporum]CAI2183902.1 18456_t:CDS:2 [Funneliformis geosporum]
MNARNLRLKTKLEWQNTQYLFNPKKNRYTNCDENVKTSLQHYWQIPLNELRIKHSPSKVVIQQYAYKPSLPGTITHTEEPNNQLSQLAIKKLSELYSTLYKKPVEFNIILFKYPFLSSKILAQYLSMQTKKYRIRQIRRNLFKKVPLVSLTNSGSGLVDDGISTHYLNWSKMLRNGNNFIPTHLAGIKLQISGRMSLRKGAARSAVVTKSIGRLRFNTVGKSMIDYAKVEGKNMNGSYCIKVWLSSATV